MTIQDLKYITPLDIQAAYLNVTSSEMYAEAKDFNMHMYDMQRKRWRFMRDFWLMVVFNVIMLALGVLSAASSYTSLLFYVSGGRGPLGFTTGGNMFVTLFPVPIYIVLFVWLVLIRKMYDSRLVLVISLMLFPVNYGFIGLTIANVILIGAMNKVDNEIKDEVGYPHFVELTLSYIRDEENAEEGGMESYSEEEATDDLISERKENPFDKYRTRWADGEGSMLADNDISTVINENNIAKE